MNETMWLSEHRAEGRLVARIGRRGHRLIAEFVGVGTLTADRDGGSSQFQPAEGADPATVERFDRSMLGALLRHLLGEMTLHGSCAAAEDAAVAFIGASGSGKSTLVAALCASGSLELVSDDTVALEISADPPDVVQIVPTQARVWLDSSACRALNVTASAAEKTPVSIGKRRNHHARLKAVVGLVFDADIAAPRLTRLRGQEAFATILKSVVRFVVDEPEVQVREFEQVAAIARQCPVFELRRSPSFDQLLATVELVRPLWISVETDFRVPS
jgi:hypothetical protein